MIDNCTTVFVIFSGAISAYFHGDAPAPAPATATAAISAGTDTKLENLTVFITPQTTKASLQAVHMPVDAMRFTARGLTVLMQQENVSNAFKIEGKSFEISGSTIKQEGSCLYPSEWSVRRQKKNSCRQYVYS